MSSDQPLGNNPEPPALQQRPCGEVVNTIAASPAPATPWHFGASTLAPPPTGAQMFEAALRYLSAGISILPIKADGSKAPEGRLLPIVSAETAQ